MVTAKEERQLKKAIENSIVTAAMDMRAAADPPKSHHRLGKEPIARNEDHAASVLEPERLLLYQRSQSMGTAEYRQRLGLERFKMHFTEVEFNEGDTLVFVDFPQPSKDKAPVDCDGVPFPSQKLRVHSEKLLATGSSRFADMFLPTYQFRTQRRRKLVNKLPEGVKYVLDLTPPSEGEEMVFQVTELSLTPGIIKWWSSYARLDVPFFLVKGHDDVCPCKDLTDRSMTAALIEPISTKESAKIASYEKDFVLTLPLSTHELVSARNHGRRLQVEDIPAHFDIPDYCPIRHRNGIIRLLMLIEGKEVFIDSAPRLWTIVALAKIWDCVSAVQDLAIQWLLQGKNSKFIEVLPEEAIRIGGIIESPQITRTAFRILVSELAFEQTATDDTKKSADFSHVTLFGRRKGDPGDEFSNLIQHAALAFVERMTSRLAELQSLDVLETWNIPDYMKLLKIEESLNRLNLHLGSQALEIITRLKTMLRSGLTWDIESLNLRYSSYPSLDQKQIDSDRATYVEPQDFQEFPDIYGTMTPLQKLLTSCPYKQLENSWLSWASRLNDAENSYRSTAKVVEALGHEMGRLSEVYKERHAWGGDISPELMDILSEDWQQPQHGISAPLTMENLDLQMRWKLGELAGKISDNGQDLQTVNSKHLLLTLTNNETKFLPLWAGGLNDGTGGVFEDQLPPADMGPNGPGPAYHTGITIPSDASSLSGSFVDDMSALHMAGSATAASVDVHDSISTVYRPDHVIADDKSIASESFHSDFADYHEAHDVVLVDTPVKMTKQTVLQSLDEFLQAPDSDDDSDSAATIGCDDFDTLDDEDEDLYMSSQSDSAAENEAAEVEMTTI